MVNNKMERKTRTMFMQSGRLDRSQFPGVDVTKKKKLSGLYLNAQAALEELKTAPPKEGEASFPGLEELLEQEDVSSFLTKLGEFVKSSGKTISSGVQYIDDLIFIAGRIAEYKKALLALVKVKVPFKQKDKLRQVMVVYKVGKVYHV
ncbi:hypothetical protein COU79_05010, partial [Candidatus Peregrinibacteria bacterium CG10_big_fil_rev_8_21_14_0_10_54_7]